MPKYTLQSYIDCDFYGGEHDEIENYTSKVVKCRKEHDCVCGCEKKIPAGEYALCFVWNTNGVGMKRGFEMEEVLVVPHGGSKNDTLCTAEKKNGG